MARKGICPICQLPANGLHYGALACDGCKSFFRRAAARKSSFVCKTGKGKCPMETGSYEASRCRACRLERCQAAGMEIIKKGKATTMDPENKHDNDLSRRKLTCTEGGSDNESSCYSDENDFPCPNSNGRSSEDLFRIDRADGQSYVTSFASSSNTVTVHVESAIDAAFGDQLARWTFSQFTDHVEFDLTHQHVPLSSQSNFSLTDRLETFLHVLPGAYDLNGDDRKGIWTNWKIIAYTMIHQAPFTTCQKMPATDCSDQWQDMMDDPVISGFSRGFRRNLNQIGLRLVERYLLIAVIMFEPVDELISMESCSHLNALHRHYIHLLLSTIKQRCWDSLQFTSICEKLEVFFCSLREINVLGNLPAH